MNSQNQLTNLIAEGAARGMRLRITAPYAPYVPPGEAGPRESKRLRQRDSTNIGDLVRQVSQNAFARFKLRGNEWLGIKVLSPYASAHHSMLMDTTPRFRGDPSSIPVEEGEVLMALVARLAEEAEKLSSGGTVCVGYNWSPFGFGDMEAAGGLQSVPTKFHPQIWAWWPFPDFDGCTQHNDFKMEWVHEEG